VLKAIDILFNESEDFLKFLDATWQEYENYERKIIDNTVLDNWAAFSKIFKMKNIERIKSDLNETELMIFGGLMKKEFNKLRVWFCEEYEMLMLVREDDFFEKFGVKIKCA